MDMKEEADTLPSLDRGDLLAPLRRMTGRPAAEALAWRVAQLGGGFGNPVSRGLYRVSGEGRDGENVFHWSLVLKAVQSPANVGMAHLGGGDDVTHWNYWRREAFVYQSDLLARLPAGVAAPRCYGVTEQPGDVYWLWLEAIADEFGGQWPVARYGLAARHLGRLSGAYLAGWTAADYPWLGRSLPRQFAGDLATFAPWSADAASIAAALAHPLCRRLFSAAGQDAFAACLLGYPRLLDALDRLPQTLGHQDAYPTNLMSRRDANGEQITVALDWALAGIAPIGSDMAQLFIGLIENGDDLDLAAAERLALDNYLQGLRDMGWSGDEAAARFGFIATTVFRLTFMLVFFLGGPVAAGPGALADEAQDNLARNLRRQAKLLAFLAPRLGELLAV